MLSRVSIPLEAAVAVVKEVESILRGVLGTALARAARSAQGRGLIEEGKRAFDRCTSVTLSAARAFLAALRTGYATRINRVSQGIHVVAAAGLGQKVIRIIILGGNLHLQVESSER